MSNSRNRYRLGDLGYVVTGRTPPGSEDGCFGSGIPFLTPTDMDGGRKIGSPARRLSDKGRSILDRVVVPHGVAVSCIGSQMGKAVLLTTEVATNQQINTIVPDLTIVDDIYLYYELSSRREEIYMLGAAGSTMPILNKTGFENLVVELPTLDEQRRIADILGTLDDKIELNRRMNETLETMARRLFRSWFVDFDPVHAKAALRRQHPKLSNADLSRRALPNMAPEIAELFPDGFEEATLGPIPQGWQVSRIEEVSEINGWTLGKNDPLEIIDYIEISQVMRGEVGEIARYQRGEEPSRARRKLRHGDFVLSTVRPDRGAYFVAIEPPATLIASTGFAVFTSTIVPWSWTSCALTSPEVFEYLGHHADGGAYPAINPALIGKIEYAIPTCVDVLNAFDSLASEWYRLAEYHRRESSQLRNIRDKLLPRLLSGELSLTAEVA